MFLLVCLDDIVGVEEACMGYFFGAVAHSLDYNINILNCIQSDPARLRRK